MRFDLTGKKALVTGASSGIGQRMAECLAEAGATVVASARRADRLEQTVDRIQAAMSVVMDVSDVESVRQGIDTADKELGGLDILVNNAGILLDKSVLKTTPEDFDRVFATNVRGMFFASQAFAKRAVAAKRGGSIVNVGSLGAWRPTRGLSAYGASKAAVHQLTKVCAQEWGPRGIRVNCIHPGYIHTEINDELIRSPAGKQLAQMLLRKRIGTPKDLDGALLLFASDAGDYLTGASLDADDGQSLTF
jgi:NAD(P)-dependent dehydrogenase (short-subunit alcohol dehydrogenase family)